VLLFTEPEGDKGDVRTAVRVNASPEHVFQTMTSCAHAMKFVPRLKHCKVLETAPDGSWQTVEHEVDGNGYLPRARYVFRAEYERFARIRCTEVSGDFRENRGLWTFRPLAGSTATLVTYTVHVVPRFYVPRWAVRASLKRELPVLMTAFREVAQAPAG
jgi:ribosome-associated toxin RatA of RatAB toxin-antitoxin module